MVKPIGAFAATMTPMTDAAGLPALLHAIKHLHGCEAHWVNRVPVHESCRGGLARAAMRHAAPERRPRVDLGWQRVGKPKQRVDLLRQRVAKRWQRVDLLRQRVAKPKQRVDLLRQRVAKRK